jgi:hypothetical protein
MRVAHYAIVATRRHLAMIASSQMHCWNVRARGVTLLELMVAMADLRRTNLFSSRHFFY